jgi:hypothetical protein
MAQDIERQNFLPECEAEYKANLAQFKKDFEDLLMKRHLVTANDCTDDQQIETEFKTGSTVVEFVEWIAEKYDLHRVNELPFI